MNFPNLNQVLYKYMFFSFLILPSIPLKGQNYIMDHTTSSFHTGVQFSYNSFENQYAILPGYTFNGRLTLGFDVGKTKDLINKINSTAFRPNISYLILKQNDESQPISLDLNVAYQYNYVTQIIFNTRSVQFGAGVYHEIKPLENVKIIPAIFFEGNKPTSSPNPQFLQTVSLAFGAQTTITWNNYYLTPKFILNEGVSTISIKLGIVFNSTNNEEQILMEN